MYREGPSTDHSSLIQQASTAISIAKQLVELFTESIVEVQQVGRTGNIEATSARIGQADQIYSSLWAQLDVASQQIANLQRDTSGYQALRTALGSGAFHGVLDVSRKPGHNGRHTVIVTSVVANRVGLLRAVDACNMLAALLPEVAWTPPSTEPPAVPAQQGVSLSKWAVGLVCGALLLAMVMMFLR